ncbi:hypothetical protein M378DRAFT_173967 [Amanita muscaria Koide BX008]|uniref:Uncharacterized protein n=1 Tax=Amanita muscaria (strain Koide BX008) TaxID=946122 RepID=A0A0C2WE73_AMAMK|nr:hypothetical protein M378DRAFT_173967 [Amanita muscaria Koide BX008]
MAGHCPENASLLSVGQSDDLGQSQSLALIIDHVMMCLEHRANETGPTRYSHNCPS